MRGLRPLAFLSWAALAACNANGGPGAGGTSPGDLLGPSGVTLLPASARTPRPDLPTEAQFKASDCDGSGHLDVVEADGFVYASQGLSDGYYVTVGGGSFEAADANRDFKLTLEELRSFLSLKATAGWEWYPLDCAKFTNLRSSRVLRDNETYLAPGKGDTP